MEEPMNRAKITLLVSVPFFLLCFSATAAFGADEVRARARAIGVDVGVMTPGPLNAITDVAGVRVGHTTVAGGTDVRTGVTAVLPHGGNLFRQKVPAAIHVYNGFGKLAGLSQVNELGDIETPIVLTNTLSVGTAVTATVHYTLEQEGNETVRSGNAVVGETNDGYLNDIRGFHVTVDHVLQTIGSAAPGPVREGCVGAGTGTCAFGYKGGIGTASRLIPRGGDGHFTVGVLLQSNFGWILNINGVPFTREDKKPAATEKTEPTAGEDGSCMIVIATDAPLSVRNLKRLARRAFSGMARTRSVMTQSSGDYAIAFSTAYRIPHEAEVERIDVPPLVANSAMNPLFRAVEEATQEAIYNSLFMATTTTGFKGRTREAIPLDRVKALAEK